MTIRAITIRPPITPPTMAPVLDLLPLLSPSSSPLPPFDTHYKLY